jgi:hypothetical protein
MDPKPSSSHGFEMSGTGASSSSTPSPISATASSVGNSGFPNTAVGQKSGPSFNDDQSAGDSKFQTSFGTATPAKSSFIPAASPGPSNTAPLLFAATPSNNASTGSLAGGHSPANPLGTWSSTPFGSTAAVPMQPVAQQQFNGKTARELLIQFYQEMNPSKLLKVDEVLQKYKGKEDEMFRKIANQVMS